MIRFASVTTIVIVVMAVAGPTTGAEFYGACIEVAGQAKAWNLPKDSGWRDILVNTLTANTASDLIVTGAVHLSNHNTPGTRVVYRFLVDDQPAGIAIMRRVPQNVPSSQDIQVAAPDLGAGNHTIRFQAQNLDPNVPVRFGVVWMTPQLIDSGFNTAANDTGIYDTVDVGSTWTTVNSVVLPSGFSPELFTVGASFRVVSGTPGAPLEYRITAGPRISYTWKDAVPAALPDGVHLSRIFRNDRVVVSPPHVSDREGIGRNCEFEIQVRTVDGGTVVIRNRYLFTQTMPDYHLFEVNESAPVSVSHHGEQPGLEPHEQPYTVVAETEYQYIPESKLGDSHLGGYLAFVGGNAFSTLPGQTALPLRWRIDLQKWNDVNPGWDAGLHLGFPGAQRTLQADIAGGCGKCGWQTHSRYAAQLKVLGLCEAPHELIHIERSTLQVLMVPSTLWFPFCPNVAPACCNDPDDTACVCDWQECCNMNPGICTWECAPGSLTVESGLAPFSCP